jgi:hypothetical protein
MRVSMRPCALVSVLAVGGGFLPAFGFSAARQQRLLVALERDAVVAAFLHDQIHHAPVAVERIAGDDLALETDEAQRGVDRAEHSRRADRVRSRTRR